MKSISEYLQLLAGYMKANAANYHITRMGIFGSVARGEETEVSDIDICLEELLGRPVDLVRVRDRMDEVLKQNIQKEAVYV